MERLTNLDSTQISQYAFDEKHQAFRMLVVNDGSPIEIKAASAPENKTVMVETIQVPVIVKETQIERIEVPTIVHQYHTDTIQVPVIVKEIEIREIEKPVIVIEYKTVEVPIIQKEIQIVEVDRLNLKALYVAQGITLLLIVLSKFI